MRFFTIVFLSILCLNLHASEAYVDEELSILSWNIYMLPGITNLAKSVEKSDKRSRAREIADMLNQSSYDIVILQESFFAPARRVLKKQTKDQYPYQYGPVNPSGLGYKTSSGIVVLSKIPLELLGTVQYESCNGVDCIAKKGAGLWEGEWNGKRFQVLGTHLNAGGPQWIRKEQYLQMSEELLEPYSKMGVPQFLCGDMNTHKEKLIDYTLMLEMLDAEDTPTFSEQVNTTVKDKSVIDYILLRPNGAAVQILDKNIQRFNAKSEVIDRLGGTLSDHLAVDITVKL